MMRARGEDGVTLVEILVVSLVLAIVVPATTAAIVVGLKTAEGTADRVALSHDAKLTGAYLAPDIRAATDVTLGSSTCTDATGTVVASFSWVDNTTTMLTSYVANATTHELVRTTCADGVVLADERVTLVHNLSDTAVTAVCAPSCTSMPRTVTVDIELCGRIPSGPAAGTCRDGTTYAFEVSAISRNDA